MIFLGVESQNFSNKRVNTRVSKGGHYVSPDNVALRFEMNPRLIDKNLSLLDKLDIYDTSSGKAPKKFIVWENNKLTYKAEQLPDWLIKFMPNLAQLEVADLKISPT